MPLIHDSSRHLRRVATAIAAVTVLGLSACASSPEAQDDSTSASPSAGTFPVTIDHAYGRTTIEVEPRRVVTLGLSDQDPLRAFGVKPVAVAPWYGDDEYATWPWAQDELGDAQPTVLNGGVRDEANPPIEEIAALEPDLIISLYNGTTKEQYAQLSDIAPVVVPDKEYTNFRITWQEATRVTGEALGREDEALDLVKGLEDEFAAAASTHPEFSGQEAIVAERFESGETIVRTGNDVRAQFFSQLGFDVPSDLGGLTPNEVGELYVPDERIDEISKDLLVWNIGSNPDIRETVEDLPLYNDLPVVKDGHTIWLEDEEISGAFTWGTILSLEYALDEFLPQVDEAVG